jgi:hypothetical protein
MAPAFSKVCPAKLIAIAIHKFIQEVVMIVSILAVRLWLLRNSAPMQGAHGVSG